MRINIYTLCLLPFVVIGCSSQSGSSSDATTVGNATNETSETNAFPNKTVPDINSMTLVVAKPNIRARGWAGVSTEVTVFVGDNLNNKTVLDGVTVNFAAEAGRIDPSCSITNGSCTVTWNSQNPEPEALDGRVTIVAWMSGAESFKDLNANGLFDGDDLFADSVARPDLSEPFVNDNIATFTDSNRPAYKGQGNALDNVTFSSVRDATETFFDTPGLTDGTFDDKDGKYSGPSCAHASLCSSIQSIFIWKETEIIVTGGSPQIEIFNATADAASMTAAVFPVAAPALLRVEVTDGFYNVLPADATIDVALSNVSGNTLTGAVGSSRFPQPYFIQILSDGTASADGKLTITVNVPADTTATGQTSIESKIERTVTD